MTKNSQTKLLKEITCPFCSLLCDDLEISCQQERLKVSANGCPIAVTGFEYKIADIAPHIHGEACTLEQAIEHAARILSNARHPLISGLGTDVAGSRAAIHLAESVGAILDHEKSDGAIRNILVLQSGGWIMTTLAELKNRADLVVFIGTDLSNNYPRFYERFIWNQSSLAGLKSNSRELIYIGKGLNTGAGINPAGVKPTVINSDSNNLLEYITVIRAMLKGMPVRAEQISHNKLAMLRKVAEQILSAEYGVFVWAPGELTEPHAELLIQSICEMVKELNKSGRYAGLSIGGGNGGITFQSVCAWQSGYPGRVSYANGYPEYNPYHLSTRETLTKSEADALLWISSLDGKLKPPKTTIPSIVLSRPSRRQALDAEVYIPVGTPGLDQSGNMFRTDSIVNLPLKQLRQSQYMSVSTILNSIRQAL